MGLLDGFPFKNRQQREREEKQFQKRVNPFGEEGKEKALGVLRQVTEPKLDDTERLWAFFAAKDKYEQGHEDGEDEVVCLRSAWQAMDRCTRMGPDARHAVLALVTLEHDLTDVQEYPTRDVVLTVADEISKLL